MTSVYSIFLSTLIYNNLKMTCPQYLYTFLNLLYSLKSAISQSRIFFPILFRVQISLEFKPYFFIRKKWEKHLLSVTKKFKWSNTFDWSITDYGIKLYSFLTISLDKLIGHTSIVIFNFLNYIDFLLICNCIYKKNCEIRKPDISSIFL